MWQNAFFLDRKSLVWLGVTFFLCEPFGTRYQHLHTCLGWRCTTRVPLAEAVPDWGETQVNLARVTKNVCFELDFGVFVAQLAVLTFLDFLWFVVRMFWSGWWRRSSLFAIKAKNLLKKLFSEGQMIIPGFSTELRDLRVWCTMCLKKHKTVHAGNVDAMKK